MGIAPHLRLREAIATKRVYGRRPRSFAEFLRKKLMTSATQCIVCMLSGAVIIFGAASADAQATRGRITTAGTWSSGWTGPVPTSADDALIGSFTPPGSVSNASVTIPAGYSASANNVVLGDAPGNSGTLTIADFGTLNSFALFVGNGGAGTLNLNSVSTLNSTIVSIHGTANVFGAANHHLSNVEVSGTLNLYGNTLNVSNYFTLAGPAAAVNKSLGGVAASKFDLVSGASYHYQAGDNFTDNVRVGYSAILSLEKDLELADAFSIQQGATLDLNGHTLRAPQFVVGNLSSSQTPIIVNNGGAVVADHFEVLNTTFWHTGGDEFHQSGYLNHGALFLEKDLTLSADLTLDFFSGLYLQSHNVSIGGQLYVGPGALLAGSGEVTGNVVVNGGTIAPGSSPGTVQINGDLQLLAGSVLQMEIGGLTPGTEYDRLIVTGNSTLAGEVEISFVNGFVPQVGDSFELFQTNGSFSAVGRVHVVNAPAGMSYAASLSEGLVTITSVPEPSSITLALGGCGAFALLARQRRARLPRPCPTC